MPALPLVLLSPNSDLRGYTDRINKISRSRLAEVQWMSYRPDNNVFDNFAERKKLNSYLAIHPLRRVAVIGDSRNFNALGFMSPLLDTKDKFLWVSPFEKTTADLLEYFLKGHLSPEAVRAQNYAIFTNWLQEHYSDFVRRFQYEYRSPAARKQHGDRSVSKWLTSAGYTDDCYKTFASHLQALAPPSSTWSMPPVPSDGLELPLVLVDIDGCITLNTVLQVDNPFVVDQLNQWSRNRTAEIRWMTSSGDDQTTASAMYVGLDTVEHGRDVFVENPDEEVQVLRWIDRNPERQIVWVDSEIHEHLSLFGQKIDGDAALIERMVQHRNLLMVQPHAKQGLTAEELQMIDTFLAGGMKAEDVLVQNSRVVQGET